MWFEEYFGSQQAYSFALAFIASMGTFLGGLIISLLALVSGEASSSNRLIGVLQASSAGVMLYMTFLDLIPESIEVIGSKETMVYFFVGVVVFGLVEMFIAPHDHDDDNDNSSHKKEDITGGVGDDDDDDDDQPKRAGLRNRKAKNAKTASATTTRTKSKRTKSQQSELKRMGLVTFLALFLHNIPEGLGVYLATMSNSRLGLELAIAICLHNIPEGMACAVPLWASTRSHFYVLGMTLLNGLAEPLGVVIGGYLLKDHMTTVILNKCLAVVAGIMACISFHELQPAAIKLAGRNVANVSLFCGMFVCFVALETVHHLVPHDHGHGHSHSHDHHSHDHHDHDH